MTPKLKLSEQRRTCKRCGTLFTPLHPRSVYCKPKCQNAAFRDQQAAKPSRQRRRHCRACGVALAPSQRTYCGRDCELKTRRESARQARLGRQAI